jgi:hypothetical protein
MLTFFEKYVKLKMSLGGERKSDIFKTISIIFIIGFFFNFFPLKVKADEIIFDSINDSGSLSTVGGQSIFTNIYLSSGTQLKEVWTDFYRSATSVRTMCFALYSPVIDVPGTPSNIGADGNYSYYNSCAGHNVGPSVVSEKITLNYTIATSSWYLIKFYLAGEMVYVTARNDYLGSKRNFNTGPWGNLPYCGNQYYPIKDVYYQLIASTTGTTTPIEICGEDEECATTSEIITQNTPCLSLSTIPELTKYIVIILSILIFLLILFEIYETQKNKKTENSKKEKIIYI